jgi:hypothetical protein
MLQKHASTNIHPGVQKKLRNCDVVYRPVMLPKLMLSCLAKGFLK